MREQILGPDECLTDRTTVVDKPLIFKGTTLGSMTVTASGVLHLHGTCSGSLYVQKGAIVIVHGVVQQDIFNEGIVELRGRVEGNVFSRDAFYHSIPPGFVVGQVENSSTLKTENNVGAT